MAVRRATRYVPAVGLAIASVLSLALLITLTRVSEEPFANATKAIFAAAITLGTLFGSFLGALPIAYSRWVLRVFAAGDARARTAAER
jgi:hypothetical protein